MADLLKSACGFLQTNGFLSEDQADDVKSFDDIALLAAMRRFRKVDANVDVAMRGMHGPADLKLANAATSAMFMPRCSFKNPNAGKLQGNGGWYECHGAKGYHTAIVELDLSEMPSFLEPVFKQVLRNVRAAYAEVGFLLRFRYKGKVYLDGGTLSGKSNIAFSFTTGDGWIGLAIVGPGSCGTTIWCRYDKHYRPADIIREWTTLIKHEIGHNVGFEHYRGGVMNWSIVVGLPISFKGDPIFNDLVEMFGGVAVPKSEYGGGDDPDEPPGGGFLQPISEPFSLDDGRRVVLTNID